MTPREMLKRAARAAGIVGQGFDIAGNMVLDWHNGKTWNSLEDDGDTQRLAVDMRFLVQVLRTVTHVADENGKHLCTRAHRPHCDDVHAATRYAVTRAAAEVARGVK